MATKNKAPSRSTKTTNKKKGLLGKLNFSSRKTQFIATILVIAVAGAGYFTYQSFAATVMTATRTNGKLLSSNAYVFNDAGKNNTPVFQLRQNSSVFADFTVPGGKTIKYCAIVRASQPTPSVLIAAVGGWTDPGIINITTSYTSQCMLRKPYGGTTNVRLSIGGNEKSNIPVFVSQLSAEVVEPTTPAPAPAK